MNPVESKLKKRRISSDLTQEELSIISGVNVKSIASYEQSTEKLLRAGLHTVIKLADGLGCTVEDLIDRKYITRV